MIIECAFCGEVIAELQGYSYIKFSGGEEYEYEGEYEEGSGECEECGKPYCQDCGADGLCHECRELQELEE